MKRYILIITVISILLINIFSGAAVLASDPLPSGIIIKFNPSGTHIDSKGSLKVRFDVYLGSEYKTFNEQYILKADEPIPESVLDKDGNIIQVLYDTWWLSVAKHNELNPAISVFVTISDITSKIELENYIMSLFNASTLSNIDNALIQQDSIHLISPYLKNKLTLEKKKFDNININYELYDIINERFKSIILISDTQNFNYTTLIPESIDVGPGAIDGDGTWGSANTVTNLTNPSNDTGSIDTIEIWTNGVATSLTAASSYMSGTTYTCRDSEFLGNITGGSKQTFAGLDIEIEINDLIGHYHVSGAAVERSNSGGDGLYYKSGEYIDADDTATFTLIANQKTSIYGTGTEDEVLPFSAPENFTLTDLDGISITANWSASANATDYNIYMNRYDYPDNFIDYELVYSGNLTSVNLTSYNLDSIRYYFGLIAYNSENVSDFTYAYIGGYMLENNLLIGHVISLIPLLVLLVLSLIFYGKGLVHLMTLAYAMVLSVFAITSSYEVIFFPILAGSAIIALILFFWSMTKGDWL